MSYSIHYDEIYYIFLALCQSNYLCIFTTLKLKSIIKLFRRYYKDLLQKILDKRKCRC